MTTKFYIISLGPGNPDLLTLQALKTLEKCDVIFVPVRSKTIRWDGSVAYKILSSVKELSEQARNKFSPIYTPMSYSPDAWQEQVDQIVSVCVSGKTAGFVTLGDAAIYSSAYYLLNIIKDKHIDLYKESEVIPGVSSLSYASARVTKPLCLGNTGLEIVPMHQEETKSTKVYMRLHKGDDTNKLDGNDLYYFENLGLDNENFGVGTPGVIENYLTVVIDFAGLSAPTEKPQEVEQ